MCRPKHYTHPNTYSSATNQQSQKETPAQKKDTENRLTSPLPLIQPPQELPSLPRTRASPCIARMIRDLRRPFLKRLHHHQQSSLFPKFPFPFLPPSQKKKTASKKNPPHTTHPPPPPPPTTPTPSPPPRRNKPPAPLDPRSWRPLSSHSARAAAGRRAGRA